MNTKLSVSNQPPMHVFLPNGGWLDYWVKNATPIKEFIARSNLRPLVVPTPVEAGKLLGVARTGTTTSKMRRIIDLGIRGGIKVPHIHFREDVYMLNDEQWEAFSKQILQQAKAVIASAKTVSFDTAMSLGSVVYSKSDPMPS